MTMNVLVMITTTTMMMMMMMMMRPVRKITNIEDAGDDHGGGDDYDYDNDK